MNRFTKLAAAAALMATVGCATQVTVTPTHRENMASQSKVLAIAALNLEDAIHHRLLDTTEEDAAHAIVNFHGQAENFAGTVATGRSDDKVSSDYEHLIEAWVKVKQTYPNLKTDSLVQEAYTRVQHEWEALARTSGYANKRYEQKVEQGK